MTTANVRRQWTLEVDTDRVAWLTFDRDDNWSPQLWLGMELALERSGALTADSGTDDPVVRLAERLGVRATTAEDGSRACAPG